MKRQIVTSIKILRQPCLDVSTEEDVSQIIIDLKDSLDTSKGVGLSANQIGYNKKVCLIKFPKMNSKTKKLEPTEVILINPKIINKQQKIIIPNEQCLSFPGLKITTDRYVFIVVQYLNERREIQTAIIQDFEAFAWQHEIDHLEGILIINRKHRDINYRKK